MTTVKLETYNTVPFPPVWVYPACCNKHQAAAKREINRGQLGGAEAARLDICDIASEVGSECDVVGVS